MNTKSKTERQVAGQKDLQDFLMDKDNPLLGIMVLQGGKIVIANQTLANIFGYSSPEEILKLPSLLSLTPHENRDVIEVFLSREVESFPQEPQIRDSVGVTCDGSEIFLKTTYSKVDWEQIPSVLITVRDRTREKETEEKAQIHEHWFRSIMENAGDAIYIADFKGIIQDANEHTCKVLGYSKEELIGMPLEAIGVLPGNLDILEQINNLNDSTKFKFQGLGIRKDGIKIPFRVRLNVTRSGDEKFILLIAEDITKELKAKEEIDQKEKLFSTVVQAAPFALLLFDKKGQVRMSNPKATELLGYEPEEFKKVNLRDLLAMKNPENHKGLEIKFWEKPYNREMGAGIRVPILNKNGSERKVEIALSPVKLNNDNMVVCYLNDLTLQETMERELRHAQKMEVIGQMAGGVAHEFNNLLSVMKGYGQLVDSEISAESETKDDMKKVLNAITRASSITGQMLTLGHKEDLESTQVELNSMVRGVLETITMMSKGKIKTNCQCSEEEKYIHADRGALEQVLLNLAINARDAMGGEGNLSVKVEPFIAEGALWLKNQWAVRGKEYVRISVQDTGEGMTDEVKKKLFEPFFTTKGAGKGTGLGLSVVFRLIQQHKGMITVDSILGKGTTFSLYLPGWKAASFPLDASFQQKSTLN